MREQTIMERFVGWIKSIFFSEKKRKENRDEIKREMCEKSILSGVCSKDCDRCAWNTLRW